MSREIKGLAIIFSAYFAGEVLSRLMGLISVGLIFPGSILGMLLLFVLLQIGVVNVDSIKGICEFVLSNMMMLFVPITVGVMVSYEMILESWFAVVVTLLISTALVLVVVGVLQQFIGRRWRR